MNETISMDFPRVLLHLEEVSVGVHRHGRWSMTIGGVAGWCIALPHGLCVGCKVDDAPIDGRWLEQACLWLIALRGESDDALWLDAANALVFVRSHDAESGATVLRESLAQQITLARWLGAHHAALQEAPYEARR